MKKTVVLGVSAAVGAFLGAAAPATASAQAFSAGYGAELGKVLVVIVPDDGTLEFKEEGSVQATTAVKGKKSVGTCDRGELSFQEATYVVDRHEGTPPVKTEVIVLHPANFEIPLNVKLGSFHETGPCGPGYRILRGHVIEVGS